MKEEKRLAREREKSARESFNKIETKMENETKKGQTKSEKRYVLKRLRAHAPKKQRL